MALCRGSYLILGILKKNNRLDKIHAMTVNEIQAIEQNSKPNTVHKRLTVIPATIFYHSILLGFAGCGRNRFSYHAIENGVKLGF